MTEAMEGISSILQEAEALVAEIDGAKELPRVIRSINQMISEGEQLRNRVIEGAPSREQADVQASILLGSRGVDLPKLSTRIEGLSTARTFAHVETTPLTDIEGFLKNERQNAISMLMADITKNTQDEMNAYVIQSQKERWESEKRKVLSSIEFSADNTADQRMQSLHDTLNFTLNNNNSSFSRTRSDMTYLSGAPMRARMSQEELKYSKALSEHNTSSISASGPYPDSIIARMEAVASQLELKEVALLWQLLKRVQERKSDRDPQRRGCIEAARRFLETKHLSDLRATVYGNLNKASLGGVPGTAPLIKAYLNVKPVQPVHPSEPMIDGHPAWAVIYHALRCGDFACARELAMRAELADFAGKLQECQRDPQRRLSDNSVKEIRLKYSRELGSGTTGNPYERVVLAILAGCDVTNDHVPIGSGNIEDYIWIRLCKVAVAPPTPMSSDYLSLKMLQALLAEDYVENFDAHQRPLQYAYVLLLTAQFELAIEFLYRFDEHKCHAVHIAIALNQLSLLNFANNPQEPLLVKRADETCLLNLPRLITSYTLRFEMTEPELALEYYYALHDQYEKLWLQCVTELVLETKTFSKILGQRNPDGGMQKGALDKFVGDRTSIVKVVAEAAEARGLNEEAVSLYDLANETRRCVELLSKILSLQVTQAGPEGSKRSKLQKIATQMAERHPSPSLSLLIDLMKFFDNYHDSRNEEALEMIMRLKIVPLSMSEVDIMVSTFCGLSEQIRRVIPDVLVALMTILAEQYKNIKRPAQRSSLSIIPMFGGGSDKKLELIKSQANAIIKYAGMVPYRLPANVNARLVQMEANMA